MAARQQHSRDDEGAKSLADFKQLGLLGEGAYSAVYKVMRLVDGEVYALKKVKLPSLSDKEKQNALNEIRLLASLRHDNVIAYKEAFFDDKTRCLCIITEICNGGDVSHQVQKCQKERSYLPEADVWRYLVGMCHGLKAMHDMQILHRDLKCANVFLSPMPDGNCIAKLADFNVSKVAKKGLCMTQTGTPYYASPEVWRDMPYDAKSDMWSLGCVLYEMVALKPPFRAEDMEGLYRKVLQGQYPRIPSHYSSDLSEAISMLLQVNPRHRPSIDQMLESPLLRRHSISSECGQPSAADLLATIKYPKNGIDLSGILPKPMYDKRNPGYPPVQPKAPPTPSAVASDRAGLDSLDAYLQRQPRSLSVQDPRDRYTPSGGGGHHARPDPPGEHDPAPPSTGGDRGVARSLPPRDRSDRGDRGDRGDRHGCKREGRRSMASYARAQYVQQAPPCGQERKLPPSSGGRLHLPRIVAA